MVIAELKTTDPSTKKETKKPLTNTTKDAYCTAYGYYCKLFKITWEKPTYTRKPTGIQPPTNEKIQMLITSTRSIKLSIQIDIIAQNRLKTHRNSRQQRINTNKPTSRPTHNNSN